MIKYVFPEAAVPITKVTFLTSFSFFITKPPSKNAAYPDINKIAGQKTIRILDISSYRLTAAVFVKVEQTAERIIPKSHTVTSVSLLLNYIILYQVSVKTVSIFSIGITGVDWQI